MRAFLTRPPSIIRTDVGSEYGVPPEFVTPDGNNLYRFYMVRQRDGVAFYTHVGRLAFTAEYVSQYRDSVRDESEIEGAG